MNENGEFNFEELRIDEKRTRLSGTVQHYNIVIKKL